MRSPLFSYLVLVLLAIALIAGCASAPATPGPTTPAPNATTRLVLLTEEYPPFNYHEDGRQAGIAIDLLNETLRRLGSGQTAAEAQFLPWEEAYNRTLTEPNTVLFAMSRLSVARTPVQVGRSHLSRARSSLRSAGTQSHRHLRGGPREIPDRGGA